MAQPVLDVVPEYEKEQHVPQQMTPPPMHEDVSNYAVKAFTVQDFLGDNTKLKEGGLEKGDAGGGLPDERRHTGNN